MPREDSPARTSDRQVSLGTQDQFRPAFKAVVKFDHLLSDIVTTEDRELLGWSLEPCLNLCVCVGKRLSAGDCACMVPPDPHIGLVKEMWPC